MCINIQSVVCNQPDIISILSLEILINPINKIIKGFIGFNISDNLVPLVQLAVLLVEPVELGGLSTDLAIWVDEPLKGRNSLVLRDR